MLKELVYAKKKRLQLETENYKMKKLTDKGKHIVKIGNHPYAKLVGRLKDKSNKTIYIHNKQLRDSQTIRCKI